MRKNVQKAFCLPVEKWKCLYHTQSLHKWWRFICLFSQASLINSKISIFISQFSIKRNEIKQYLQGSFTIILQCTNINNNIIKRIFIKWDYFLCWRQSQLEGKIYLCVLWDENQNRLQSSQSQFVAYSKYKKILQPSLQI